MLNVEPELLLMLVLRWCYIVKPCFCKYFCWEKSLKTYLLNIAFSSTEFVSAGVIT